MQESQLNNTPPTQAAQAAPPLEIRQPPALALPKGGGAMRGLGETFTVNGANGTGALAIPIALSPGRGDFAPQLTLTYDSGAGNGPFGLGWQLSLLAITRKTDKGLPQYNDVQAADVFMLAGAEELVPFLVQVNGQWRPEVLPPRVVAGQAYQIQRYRPRVEGFFGRIERWTNLSDPTAVCWRSITKENLTSWYGQTAESRIVDPADPTRIFSWLLCQSYDAKGNVIIYRYKAENNDGLDLAQAHEANRNAQGGRARRANRYLKRVCYGNRQPYLPVLAPDQPWPQPAGEGEWYFDVVFDYGEHDDQQPTPQETGHWQPRPDPFSSYRATFEVRTYRRCRRILLFHHLPTDPADLTQVGYDGLVSATEFTYAATPADNTATPIYSQLARVTQWRYQQQPDGAYHSQALPPLDFTYSQPSIATTLHEVTGASLEQLPSGIDGSLYQWIDLDGDGVAGILSEQGGSWFYKRNLSPLSHNGVNNAAHFAPTQPVATLPNLSLARGAQLLDLAGDGRPDLVQWSGPTPGFYERTVDGEWTTFTGFTSLPTVDWRDPKLKWIDLDGDGHTDLLLSEDDAWIWHRSLDESGFAQAQRTPKAWDEEQGPRLVLADGEGAIFLADLAGDGLTDLVRIRNGEICYWPNLGYGHFGAKVTMDNAPLFDHPDMFDHSRLRLVDSDGSGTADIIYLHRNGARLYFNQSGNGWSNAHLLTAVPLPDNLRTIQAFDLLGNGTACLVWSSPLPSDGQRPLRYLPLMAAGKPHLLIKSANNLGAETQIDYAPSTHFYLQDQAAGQPWRTKLPFPVHCVAKVAVRDKWRQTHFTTTYSYHHGYFDGPEREFRGFGRVEQIDVESYGSFAAGHANSPYITADQTLYQPPIKTVTWYHTGALLERTQVMDHFAHEYFPHVYQARLQASNFRENHLPQPDLAHLDLSPAEWRQALRAGKGMTLRQEIYELDVAALAQGEARPVKLFSAADHTCHLRRLQPQAGNPHAIFLVTESEAITYHYELDLRPEQLIPDPRIAHTLNLRIDEVGNIEQQVSVVYGRAGTGENEGLTLAARTLLAQVQDEIHLVYTETRYTNDVLEADHYRLRLPYEVLTYALTGIVPKDTSDATTADPVDDRYFTLDELRTYRLSSFYQPDEAEKIAVTERAYHELPAGNLPQKRLIDQTRTLFFQSTLATAEPLGTLNHLALPYEAYQLALTPALLTGVFADKFTPAVQAALDDKAQSGYRRDESGHYWLCSGVAGFHPDAAQHFYLPERYTDPFGNVTTLTYDQRDLYVQATEDALGNRTAITRFDCRLLAPRQMQDQNDNLSAVAFDLLGLPTALALLGKGDEGDNLSGFDTATLTPDLATRMAFFVTNDYSAAQAKALLGNATARHLYYFGEVSEAGQTRWGQHPPGVAIIMREQHVVQRADSPVQTAFEYADGAGNVLVKKVQAEPEVPGGPLRWVASGKTILNNKGKPVKQYEPYFSPAPIGHRFAEPVAMGVTPVLYYDAVGRLIRTEAPDGAYRRVDFSPWQVTNYDANDTSTEAGNGWFARMSTSANTADQRAAQLAAQHANTPMITFLDSLGREVITIAHNRVNGVDEKQITFTKLDAEGKALWVQDARGNRVLQYILPPRPAGQHPFDDEQNLHPTAFIPGYDLAGNLLFQHSMDGGDRWHLNDGAGKPLFAWSSRGFQRRFAYDVLHRPTAVFVTPPDEAERQVERLIYGEGQPSAANHHLRGKLYQHGDAAGMLTVAAYDFKGNPLTQQHQLLVDYKNLPDWSQNPPLEAETFTTQTSFDALNRPLAITTPDQSVYRPTFNEANLLDKVDLNLRGASEHGQPTWTPVVTNLTYDAKGQRTRIDYANGATTTYGYDDYTFRLINLKTTRPTQPDATASALFVNASVVQDLQYTYDPVGNITRIADKAHKPIFFANQQLDAGSDYTYDALYRLIAASGRERKDAGQYDWNDSGNTLLMPPSTAAALGGYVERYSYDAVGNLLHLVHHAGSDIEQPGVVAWLRRYEYAAANNHLLATSLPGDLDGVFSAKYTYDPHGNMTTMPHLPTMQWDYQDQLHATAQQVVNEGTPATTYYVYDAAGQRVRKVTENQNGVRTKERRYLGGYEVYREYANDGTVALERQTLHVMDDQQRIALVETQTVENGLPVGSGQSIMRYQLSNQLGSACLELDREGQLISYEEYTPYGSTAYCAGRNGAEVSLKRYRYTGKERDEETGLNYHGARYYAPWLGRWTSCDPEGTIDSFSLYVYVANNPLRHADPSGGGLWDKVKSKAATTVDRVQAAVKPGGSVFEAVDSAFNKNAHPVSAAVLNNMAKRGEDLVTGVTQDLKQTAGDYADIAYYATHQREYQAKEKLNAAIQRRAEAPLRQVEGAVVGFAQQVKRVGEAGGDIAYYSTLGKKDPNADAKIASAVTDVVLDGPQIILTVEGAAGAAKSVSAGLPKAVTPPKGAMTGRSGALSTRPISPGSISRLNRAVENRMQQLGIPKKNIGIPEYGGTAFDPHSATVGGNIQGRGINVDAGILSKSPTWKAWNRANLRTRVDAVIAHEWAEFQGASHAEALKVGPKSTLPISDQARALLRDMRAKKIGIPP